MSYRCEICKNVSGRGDKLRRHAIKRSNGSTERELALCEDCDRKVVRDGLAAVMRAWLPLEDALSIMPPPAPAMPAATYQPRASVTKPLASSVVSAWRAKRPSV